MKFTLTIATLSWLIQIRILYGSIYDADFKSEKSISHDKLVVNDSNNSFVEYRDVIDKTYPRSSITLNISDIIKLVNDKKIENILVKGSSICYY